MRRQDFIPQVIKKFGYSSYLEIGCGNNEMFKEVHLPDKIGVDPASGGTLRTTSDVFFSINTRKFDVIFIDGLHQCDQALKDIENALRVLNKNGVIFVHDCNPPQEVNQVIPPVHGAKWNGDTWKAFALIRKRKDVDSIVGDFEHGFGVIKIRENQAPIEFEKNSVSELVYSDLEENRKSWFGLLNADEILDWM
jgi:SAM-dependent methyltransferase